MLPGLRPTRMPRIRIGVYPTGPSGCERIRPHSDGMGKPGRYPANPVRLAHGTVTGEQARHLPPATYLGGCRSEQPDTNRDPHPLRRTERMGVSLGGTCGERRVPMGVAEPTPGVRSGTRLLRISDCVRPTGLPSVWPSPQEVRWWAEKGVGHYESSLSPTFAAGESVDDLGIPGRHASGLVGRTEAVLAHCIVMRSIPGRKKCECHEENHDSGSGSAGSVG